MHDQIITKHLSRDGERGDEDGAYSCSCLKEA